MQSAPSAAGFSILIVDDEANIRKTLAYCLEADGHSTCAVGQGEAALAEAKGKVFHLAFVDLKLGAANGLELIPRLLADSPWLKIVVVTGYASVETAVEAMRLGAADYLSKPFSPDQVRLLVQRFAGIHQLESQVKTLQEDLQRLTPAMQVESQNPAMQRVIETAQRAADSEAIVLLQGESGTGKSILAKAIHQWSRRNRHPFAVVACPAMPSELLEAELFGHAKGAFTGAMRDNPGRIAACEGGTLFLDEIGDLAPPLQVKLLRFLQDKEYERLGDAQLRKADVRILAATNANLEQAVKQGSFREDLFYRLNVISLVLPPLRQRTQDILPLASDYLSHFSRSNRKICPGFTPEAEAALLAHPWPGNLRELRNAIERAVILGQGGRVGLADLPPLLVPAQPAPKLGDPLPLAVIEEQHIRQVLAQAASLQEAANLLGLDPATLWRKRKQYGI